MDGALVDHAGQRILDRRAQMRSVCCTNLDPAYVTTVAPVED